MVLPNDNEGYIIQANRGGIKSSTLTEFDNRFGRLLFKHTFEENEQSFNIDLTSFNLPSDANLRMYFNIQNGQGIGVLQLMVNNQTTDTDYQVQRILQNGGAISTTVLNNSNFIITVATTDSIQSITKLSIANSRFVYSAVVQRTTNSPQTFNLTGYSDGFTLSSITHINLVGSIADIIGIGSYLKLYLY